MVIPRIIRFEPYGPAGTGLQEWEPIDPASLEAGEPVQRGHIYHQDEAAGYMAGVWDCTPMTGRFEPYEVNEFMLLLEGSMTMVAADGRETTINAGETFVLPKGLPCQWKQEEYVRKYFVIFGDPDATPTAEPDALSVILPQSGGPAGGLARVKITDPSIYLGEVPQQHEHVYFQDRSAQMTVGVWTTTPFETAPNQSPRSEFMHLVEGSVTLTDSEGSEHEFKAGDSVYVPKGAVCGWKSTGHVRKIYTTFKPSVT